MSAPKVYDIEADSWREATQADVDQLRHFEQLFGLIIRFMRASHDPRDHAAATLMVTAARREVGYDDVSKQLFALLKG